MASLFEIKEEGDEESSALPNIESGPEVCVKLQNESDNSSNDNDFPGSSEFHATRYNSESEAATYDMLDENFSLQFDSQMSNSVSDVKSGVKSLKRRKSEEARLEAKNKKEMEEEEREKMQVLVSNFTEDQLDRYEMYRRAAFPKAAIKRLMQTISGCSVSQNVVIAMSGIAKVFVGEIVEQALDVMEDYGDTGPLQPKHLREAIRIIRARGGMPNKKPRRSFYKV